MGVSISKNSASNCANCNGNSAIRDRASEARDRACHARNKAKPGKSGAGWAYLSARTPPAIARTATGTQRSGARDATEPESAALAARSRYLALLAAVISVPGLHNQ